jgi:uncharacterized Zn finger protein
MTTPISPQVFAKARGYAEGGHVSQSAEATWKVEGSRPGRPYIVNADIWTDTGRARWSFATCTCPHGQNSTTVRCSHLVAVAVHVLLQCRDGDGFS